MIRILPPEGASHPIFADMDNLDAIEVFYAYHPDAPRQAFTNAEIDPWHDALRDACTAIAGTAVALVAYWNASATRLVFPKVPHHRAVLDLIVARAAAYPRAVNQLIIRRGRANAHTAIEETTEDPRAPRELHAPPQSNQELWDGTFTDKTLPFESVANDISLMIGTNSEGGAVPEMRLAAPYDPDIRIVGYLGQIETVEPPADNARAEALMRRLIAAIGRQWPEGVPPARIINRKGIGLPHMDRIAWRGRTGFAFAIMRDTDALVQPLVDTLRMREDELIAAALDVIRAEKLYLALNWERENRVIIFNLWE